MGVFKDDQIVARVLGGKQQDLKKSTSKKTAIAGIALVTLGSAVLAVGAWVVIAKRGMPASAATSTMVPAVDAPKDTAAAQPALLVAAQKPAAGEATKVRKHLPPVIEEFRVEAVELNPKFAVKIFDAAPSEPAGHKPAEASATASAPTPAPAGDAGVLCAEGKKLEDAANGNLAQLEKARAIYQKALDSNALTSAQETKCLARLNELTAKLVLDSKAICTEPKAEFHKVETGEVVEKIAKKFKVNQGQIKRINHLNDRLSVRVGQNLKMLPGETVFKVDKEKLTGTLYIDGIYIKRFPVGIGPGNATPKGSYTVENKVLNPDWYYEGKKVPYGDAKNILGTRWMGMANSVTGSNGAGLGVHGTAHPESVPGRESKGCVRMHNEDVEELYDYMPQGGKVIIE